MKLTISLSCKSSFSFAFKLVTSVLVVMAIISLVLWLVFCPNGIEVYVPAANLTTFIFTNSTNELQYNVSITMYIKNPNKRVELYYDCIQARVFYGDAWIATVQLPTFYQGYMNTTELFPTFAGIRTVKEVRNAYDKEKKEGHYHIRVKLYTSVRLRLESLMKIHREPHVDCELKLPAPENSSAVFNGSICNVY